MASKYTDDQKQAVIEAIATGESVRSVAARLGLAPSTVDSWSQRARSAVSNTEQKQELGEQVAIVLSENLRALTSIARLAADRAYTERQDANSLAILYGVIADKSIRILAGLRPSGD